MRSRAWPIQSPHYFSWSVNDKENQYVFVSKVAYQTAEEAGFMGYQIWRDFLSRRAGITVPLDIYVQQVTLESAAMELQDHGTLGIAHQHDDLGPTRVSGATGRAVSG